MLGGDRGGGLLAELTVVLFVLVFAQLIGQHSGDVSSPLSVSPVSPTPVGDPLVDSTAAGPFTRCDTVWSQGFYIYISVEELFVVGGVGGVEVGGW